MELYILDPVSFRQEEVIDAFESTIWTERYYGDDDFELSVDASYENMLKLPKGTILLCEDSDIPMILETRDIKDGLMKCTGISLTQWLNNRIIRTTADHSVKEWLLEGYKPGAAMQQIVANFCIPSSYLDGTINIGILTAQVTKMPVPGLSLGSVDNSGVVTKFSVPFGPVYDVLKQIATTYEIGIKVIRYHSVDFNQELKFVTYKGTDRTTDGGVNPVIRFSPEMDTFANIHDLESITESRNWVYTFAPAAQSLGPTAGRAAAREFSAPSFDLRVTQIFADDITSASVGADLAKLNEVLTTRAGIELFNRRTVQLVDGEIVKNEQIEYGTDYTLGDVIEVEGNSGVIQNARITEYIRAQDQAGERAYPTLAAV
jgi:hypothetical protein